MTCKVFRLFVNIPTADDKHSFLSRDNLMQVTQVHLSEKQKTFSEFFCAFFNFSTALLPYSLITVKVIELKKVTLCDMEDLKTVC